MWNKKRRVLDIDAVLRHVRVNIMFDDYRKLKEGKTLKIALLILMLVILVSTSLISCGVKETDEAAYKSEEETSGTSQEDEGSEPSWTYDGSGAVKPEEKREIVTISCDASGEVEKITSEVSLKLKEDESKKPIEDISNLTEIKNKKGGEEFDAQSGKIYWENLGEDIEYEGEGTGDIPVTLKITYSLDEKEITPDELEGKSGKLKMRIDYVNNTAVPFTAITALFLPEDVLKNAEVKNGNLTSMSSQDVVIGTAFPGLAKSLNATKNEILKDIDIPEYIEITADCENFDMDFSTTIVRNGVFSEVEDSEDIDKLISSVADMREAADSLASGASSLTEGETQLRDGVDKYVQGVGSVSDGIYAMWEGLYAVDSSTQTLIDGATSLRDGINALNESIGGLSDLLPETLDETERASVEYMISELKTQMDALYSGSVELAGGISQYGGGVSKIATSIPELYEGASTLHAEGSNLISGVDSLVSGSETLRDGMITFRDEGISELADFVEKDLADLDDRIKKLKELDSGYTSYSGSAEGVKSSVIYIIETK